MNVTVPFRLHLAQRLALSTYLPYMVLPFSNLKLIASLRFYRLHAKLQLTVLRGADKGPRDMEAKFLELE